MVVLQNERVSLRMVEFGARLTSLRLADGTETLLGYPDDAMFRHDPFFLGATVGRYANRLMPFEIDGQRYSPAPNEGAVCLHGGPAGFGNRTWELLSESKAEAVFRFVSAEGDQGFPGQVTTELRVLLVGSSVHFQFEAETTRATPINLTLHPYFNLGSETIEDHYLTLDATGVLVVDNKHIPTGEVLPVVGSDFDLTTGEPLAAQLAKRPVGLDHCFLTPEGCEAIVKHPLSGRELIVSSDAPAVQIYTGAALKDTQTKFGGLAIEPQSVPNGPNLPQLGDTILRPGELYRREITYSFS